jgi:hypothetical protein
MYSWCGGYALLSDTDDQRIRSFSRRLVYCKTTRTPPRTHTATLIPHHVAQNRRQGSRPAPHPNVHCLRLLQVLHSRSAMLHSVSTGVGPTRSGHRQLNESRANTSSHGFMTPIDVVKTRIQIDPALKGFNLLSGARKIVAAEGPRGLITGAGPTFVGYLYVHALARRFSRALARC